MYNPRLAGYNTNVVKGGDGMKKFTTATTTTQELTEVTCNICGNAIKKNEMGYFDDFLEIKKTWGYHSPMDGETHTFDVCAGCYQEWVGGFRVKAE